MIQIKEAYRLLRRSKRKSITMVNKIFILAEITIIEAALLTRAFFLRPYVIPEESAYFITRDCYLFFAFSQSSFCFGTCDVPCFAYRNFFFVERALYIYFIVVTLSKGEMCDEIDIELSMISLEFQAPVDFLLAT